MPTTHPHEINIIKGSGEDFHLFHDMLGNSAEMQDVFDKVKRVAPCEASVLIRGETGTGKELVAKALHTRSSRAKGPFLAINCATLTPELLASELFGHVRGAFTGAIKDKKGLFELAHQGTLFLDEIAELPLLLQARLLRVIQEQQFIPVGGTEPIKVDVRLLSATHRALRAEVEHGRFRADLMYRLRVIPLYLPPLRQRGSDILLVTRFLIHTLNVRLEPLGQSAKKGLSPEAELAIKNYSWPGNIRELSNALEYALIMGHSQYIEFEDLPPELKGERPIESIKSRTDENSSERGAILRALSINNGHRGEAAKDLGMSRATLWRKMKQLGLLKENKVKSVTDQF
jgi:two-component system, NtrC family, response regulator AtoC